MKIVTPSSAYENNWSDFSAVKMIIKYYDNNWLLYATKIIFEKSYQC